jgi:hypothetical protein
MLYDLPSDHLSFEQVKAAKKRVAEAKKSVAEDQQVHRNEKLALLRLLAMQRVQRTDASMQKVEQALAHFAEAGDGLDAAHAAARIVAERSRPRRIDPT